MQEAQEVTEQTGRIRRLASTVGTRVRGWLPGNQVSTETSARDAERLDNVRAAVADLQTERKNSAIKRLLFPEQLINKVKSHFSDAKGIDITQPISAEELQEQGVGMVNTIGEGTRAIVQTIQGRDVSHQLFLTGKDLEDAQQELSQGMTPEQLRDISGDMSRFMEECNYAMTVHTLLNPTKDNRTLILFQASKLNILRCFFQELERTAKSKSKLPTFLQRKKHPQLSLEQEGEVIQQITQEVTQMGEQYADIKQVRGMDIEDFAPRREGKNMAGACCPVVGCQHVFENPMGIKYFDREAKLMGSPRTLRMNEASIHLAEHGIASNGEASDPDQWYFTIKDYLPIYGKRDESIPQEIDPATFLLNTEIRTVEIACGKLGIKPDRNIIESIVKRYSLTQDPSK